MNQPQFYWLIPIPPAFMSLIISSFKMSCQYLGEVFKFSDSLKYGIGLYTEQKTSLCPYSLQVLKENPQALSSTTIVPEKTHLFAVHSSGALVG
jgi:hypothetical protein